MYKLIQTIPKYQDQIIVKTDPRVKSILLILFIAGVLFSFNLFKVLMFLFLIGILLWGSRLPFIPLIKTVSKIYPMILIVSLFQIISQIGGEQFYSGFGSIKFETANWIKLLLFQLKSIVIILAGLVFIVSTPYPLLLKSLKKMHWPDKAIALMFFIYRFIFILSHELYRIYLAFRSRYIRLPIWLRLRVYSNLISIYFVRIFDRNEQLFKALISRGFKGKVYCHLPLIWKKNDTLILLTGITILSFIHVYI